MCTHIGRRQRCLHWVFTLLPGQSAWFSTSSPVSDSSPDPPVLKLTCVSNCGLSHPRGVKVPSTLSSTSTFSLPVAGFPHQLGSHLSSDLTQQVAEVGRVGGELKWGIRIYRQKVKTLRLRMRMNLKLGQGAFFFKRGVGLSPLDKGSRKEAIGVFLSN